MGYHRFGAPIKSTELEFSSAGIGVESEPLCTLTRAVAMPSHNPEPPVKTASTRVRDPELAAAALARQLRHEHLGCVLFFCSVEYDLTRLGPALKIGRASCRERV